MLGLKESSDFIQKCINSCKTEDQLNSCYNMVRNLANRSENKEGKDIILAHFETKITDKLNKM